MSTKVSNSSFKPGDAVKLTKPLAGFPKGHPFIVVDSRKNPAEVGGHHYKYTIKVYDMNDKSPDPAKFPMPQKYLKRL